MSKQAELADQLLNSLNTFSGHAAREFINQILVSGHPTLQQKFMSDVVIGFIRTVVLTDHYVDGRNEEMKRICQKLYEVLKSEGRDIGLPFI